MMPKFSYKIEGNAVNAYNLHSKLAGSFDFEKLTFINSKGVETARIPSCFSILNVTDKYMMTEPSHPTYTNFRDFDQAMRRNINKWDKETNAIYAAYLITDDKYSANRFDNRALTILKLIEHGIPILNFNYTFPKYENFIWDDKIGNAVLSSGKSKSGMNIPNPTIIYDSFIINGLISKYKEIFGELASPKEEELDMMVYILNDKKNNSYPSIWNIKSFPYEYLHTFYQYIISDPYRKFMFFGTNDGCRRYYIQNTMDNIISAFVQKVNESTPLENFCDSILELINEKALTPPLATEKYTYTFSAINPLNRDFHSCRMACGLPICYTNISYNEVIIKITNVLGNFIGIGIKVSPYGGEYNLIDTNGKLITDPLILDECEKFVKAHKV